MTTKIIVLALCTLLLLALAVLALVGKLDRLYTMFYPADSLGVVALPLGPLLGWRGR